MKGGNGESYKQHAQATTKSEQYQVLQKPDCRSHVIMVNTMDQEKYKNIDEYILRFPENVQDIMQKLRQVTREAAPDAQEAISYGIPTFKLNGNLVHFGGYKTHVGFYPTPSAIEAFKKDLAPYEISKGTVKFPLNKPIPYDLVKKMVEFRVKEVLHNK